MYNEKTLKYNIKKEADKMLVRYSFKNFRSFYDTAEMSMVANSQTTLNSNLIRLNQKRFLPSAVIYGANASGKSNVILSLNILRSIIVNGSISSSNDILNNMELYPFIYTNENKPISFEIEFINNNTHCLYILEINVEKLKRGSDRYISKEELYLQSKTKKVLIYSRNKNSINISTELSALRYMKTNSRFISEIQQKLNQNIDKSVLFLTGGFKSIISGEIADCVISFFNDKLFIMDNFISGSSRLKLTSNKSIEDEFILWNEVLEKFVKGADFGPQKIFFKSNINASDDRKVNMELYSQYSDGKHGAFVPAKIMESVGTLKMIDFALLFMEFFQQGCVFIMDEFDSSLHPEIIKGIIALFNDPEVNKNASQLIFTTHNPIYLNNKIFRRDQIMFVEKDKDNFKSEIYTLADFGSTEVRNDENYLINYFKGKYSSMPYIDFSSVISQEDDE